MKELIDEDLFDQIEKSDAICITTNCTVTLDNNEFVNPMGGGCAGAAKRLWPAIDYIYGLLLSIAPHVPCILGYANQEDKEDFINPEEVTMNAGWCAVVAYPTMHSIMDPADLNLVIRSALLLVELANFHQWKSIVVPRMGAGIGGLNWETQVKPAVENILDDRFTIIHKEFISGPFTRSWKSTSN